MSVLKEGIQIALSDKHTRRSVLAGGLAFAVTACVPDTGPRPPFEVTPEPRPAITATPILELPQIDVSRGPSQTARDLMREAIIVADNVIYMGRRVDPAITSEWGRNHVLKQALFYRQLTHSDRVVINNPSSVSMDGKTFNLLDPTQRVIADALMQIHIAEQVNESFYVRQPDEVRKKILQLADSKFKFSDVDGLPYVEASKLAEIQPALDLLEKSGKPLPEAWSFGANRPQYDQNKKVLSVNMYNPLEGLGQYYVDTDPQLLTRFKQVTEEVEKNASRPSLQPGLMDLRYTRTGYQLLTLEETVARSFEAFIKKGQMYRNRINYALSKKDETTAKILEAQYNVLKNWLGFETMGDGILKPKVDIKPGNILEVIDYDQPPGVIVRKQPTSDNDPRGWVIGVFGGVRVKVLGDTFQRVLFENEQLAVDMVRVQTVSGEVGWMPSQYLKNP